MEDDWEFYRPGFIERSLQILRRHPKCLQVWIRSVNDARHPRHPRIYQVKDVQWQKLTVNFEDMWHGFSFNPGLRRLADYVLIDGYGSHAKFDFRRPNHAEAAIGQLYKDRGYFAAILFDQKGYVKHIGAGQRVRPPE